ncbi:MAG: response regulator [Deltaproteobacteria bacterium]|nr:response regulator [Deltaproteobacteria bacterium]
MDERRIGDLLVEAGVISRDELERVLARKPDLGGSRVLSELYALGLANERQLACALAQRAGAPVVVLTESTIDLNALVLVPEHQVRANLAVPVAVDARTITVATPNPDAPGLSEPIAYVTGRRVVPVLGIHDVLVQVIERAYAALEQGAEVLRGDKSSHWIPRLEMAAHLPRPKLDEAGELARALLGELSQATPTRGVPLGALRLKRIMVEQATRAPAAEAPPLPLTELAAEPPSGPPLALVVDDDADIRKLLTTALRHDGLVVEEAAAGDEAIALLRRIRPSVVLLDANLPGVHGFEVCAALKQGEVHRHLPIIMISAIYRGWMQAREIQEVHGADFFVEKPFELQYVRRLVADILKREPPASPTPAAVAERLEVIRASYEKNAGEGLSLPAAADVDLWLQLDPFDGRGWLERGNLAMQEQDWATAMTSYEAATIYDPSLIVAFVGLAMALEQLGFVRRARTTWLRARSLAVDVDDQLRARIELHLK